MKSACFIAVFVVFLLILFNATPANAHGVGQATPTNYLTTLKTFTPKVDGVSLSVVKSGDQMQLTNNSSQDVIIQGYEGEDYIRVGKSGTYVNSNSPAYYLNQTSDGTTPVPEGISATNPVEWKKLSSSQTVLWHDHRTHWMSTIAPPLVQTQPDQFHVIIPNWELTFNHAGQTLKASGDLTWVPGPSPIPWYVLTLILVIISLVVMISSRMQIFAPVLLGVMLLVDMLHTFGNLAVVPGDSLAKFSAGFESATPLVIAWIVGIYGAIRLRVSGLEAPWYVLLSAAIVSILGGFLDYSALSSSQIPTVLPLNLARFSIVIAGGVGLGLLFGSLMLIRRQRQFAEGIN